MSKIIENLKVITLLKQYSLTEVCSVLFKEVSTFIVKGKYIHCSCSRKEIENIDKRLLFEPLLEILNDSLPLGGCKFFDIVSYLVVLKVLN